MTYYCTAPGILRIDVRPSVQKDLDQFNGLRCDNVLLLKRSTIQCRVTLRRTLKTDLGAGVEKSCDGFGVDAKGRLH